MRWSSRYIRVCLAAAIAVIAHASEVMKLSVDERLAVVSHDKSRRWKLSDSVCLSRNSRDIACGSVTKVTPKAALVKLSAGFAGLKVGDRARLAGPERGISSVVDRASLSRPGTPYSFQLSLGMLGSLALVSPILAVEINLLPEISLGLSPTFFMGSDGTNSVVGAGGFLTANYYRRSYFRGLWFRTGPGVYSITASTSSNSTSKLQPAFLVTAGWRDAWRLPGSSMSWGIAVGLQYITDPVFDTVAVGAVGFQPVLIGDVGYSF